MRIHYVSPHFFPDVGGVEDHVLFLARYMLGRGHEVTVHTLRKDIAGETLPPRQDLSGILIRRYDPGISLGYFATTFMPRIGEGDILHAHGYAFLANDMAIRHYHGRMGTLMTMHHGVRMAAPDARAKILRAVYDTYGLRTLKRCDRVIVSSEPDRQWLMRRGFHADKLVVVPVGIDDDAFVPGDVRFATRHGLGPFVMFLGRVHPEKSVDQLIRAFATLRRPGLQLAVVGPDAGATPGLRKLAESLGVAPAVKFLGQVPIEDKRGLLAATSLLVLPSFFEAQGTTILEAWAQRKPIVASRVGGIPAMVKDGVNGLLYEWGDVGGLTAAIGKVLDDPALSMRLASAGFETASSSYRAPRLAATIESLYSASLAGRPFRHRR